jgi:hypothetical protein
MKLVLKDNNLKSFIQMVKICKGIGKECTLVFKDDTLQTIMLAGGNAGVRLTLPKESFEVFEGEGSYGIFIENLFNVIKDAKGELTLEENEDQLSIIVDKDEFQLPFLANAEVNDRFLSQEFPIKINTTFEHFTTHIGKLEKIKSEHVIFDIQDNKITFNGDVHNKKAKIFFMDYECEEAVKTKFSIQLLKPILLKSSDEIEIQTGEVSPLFLKYESNNMLLEYVAAPMFMD